MPAKLFPPQPEWIEKDGMFCVSEHGARLLLEREIVRDAYEKQLEITIEGCNEILN